MSNTQTAESLSLGSASCERIASEDTPLMERFLELVDTYAEARWAWREALRIDVGVDRVGTEAAGIYQRLVQTLDTLQTEAYAEGRKDEAAERAALTSPQQVQDAQDAARYHYLRDVLAIEDVTAAVQELAAQSWHRTSEDESAKVDKLVDELRASLQADRGQP